MSNASESRGEVSGVFRIEPQERDARPAEPAGFVGGLRLVGPPGACPENGGRDKGANGS